MDEYVKSVKEGLEKSVGFFGNKNKQERELWVLREFLNYLPGDVNLVETKGSSTEPNDVFYYDLGFQVKEVQTEERKRGKEIKDKLYSITKDTTPNDFIEPYSPVHISLSESLPRVDSELGRHRLQKYNDSTSHMNVLVYLNLTGTTYLKEEVDLAGISDELDLWKSVSLVTNNCAMVLRCNDRNNNFLVPLVGVLYFKA